MTGFVRAVAVAERSLSTPLPRTAGYPAPDDVIAIDEARRDGLRVILLSERSYPELARRDDLLLDHVDAVVAESGHALAVGHGPVRRLPTTRREALLEVLHELDVDPHDTLGVWTGEDDKDLLDVFEVAVAVRPGLEPEPDPLADYSVAGTVPGGLRRVLDETRHGRPVVSPPRHDVRAPGGWIPGGHANLLVCAGSPARRGLPTALVGRWSAAGYAVVVLDLAGRRYRSGRRIEAGRSGWREELDQGLRARFTPAAGPLVVSLRTTPAAERSAVVTRALATVSASRARSGRPHWLVIDPAETLLADRDLPPEALDLGVRGHCLVLRDETAVPGWLLDGLDAVLPCGPACGLQDAGTRSLDWQQAERC